MAKILIIEDDKELVKIATQWLQGERHHVECAENGEDGLEYALSGGFDLFIIDINLPGMSGLELCKQYRDKGGQAPVIMLTGQREVEDKENGFNAGADDYLTKPFHLRELSARISALFRRPAAFRANVAVGKLTLDTNSHKILKDGTPLVLMPIDFALLEFLMRHAGETFSIDTLITRVWSTDKYPTVEAVRSAVKRLRKVIDDGKEESMIETVSKVGYRLLKE